MKIHAPSGQAEAFESLRGGLFSYPGIPKRIFDILLFILIAPIAFPIIAILWLLVRLDGGPGFYKQIRVGRGGQRFTFYKLRTMVVDSEVALERLMAADAALAYEWSLMQKLDDDPRITPLGHFLRATSLDELPQIWNVFLGEMSIVGPRPFMVDQELDYLEAGGVGYYQLRPGITGLWQVSARNDVKFADRVAFDNAYCETVSFKTDVMTILKTVPAVLSASGQ